MKFFGFELLILLMQADVTFPEIQPRIVGGSPATFNELPWLVHLIPCKGERNTQCTLCGGALVSSTVILTAAHCIYDIKSVEVKLNAYYFKDSLPTTYTFDLTGKDAFVHPQFSSESLINDIGYLLMPSAVNLGTVAMTEVSTKSDELLSIAGWGHTSYEGLFPVVLQTAEVEVMSDKECADRKRHGPVFIPEVTFCAGYDEGGIDACQGDSGGPAYKTLTDGSHVLYGLISWGDQCALPLKPGVYRGWTLQVDLLNIKK